MDVLCTSTAQPAGYIPKLKVSCSVLMYCISHVVQFSGLTLFLLGLHSWSDDRKRVSPVTLFLLGLHSWLDLLYFFLNFIV